MFVCLHAPGNLPLLVECARHFSPLIEETAPDAVIFDIRGLNWTFGSAEQIAREIERRVGITANLAIASNPDAALHAARGFRGVTIVPRGKEASVLALLPLFLLGGSPEFARSLDLWGIRTFGQLASLPPLGVAARLGDEGVQMQQRARGEDYRQLRLLVDPLIFCEEKELEDAVNLLEPLLFLFSQMLRELCERLRFHGRSTNEIRVRLKLERAADHLATLRLPVPMLDSKVLLKLLQLELNDRPPQAAVEKIQIELMPVEPRNTQHGLFLPASPEPERLEITLARIRGLVGAENIGAAELLNTYHPDRFRLRPLKMAAGAAVPLRPKLILRRLRPACPAQVLCIDGKPTRITSSQTRGPVVASAGPWNLSGDWWSDDVWDRQSWDIEVRNGGVLHVYQERQADWFIAGHYD